MQMFEVVPPFASPCATLVVAPMALCDVAFAFVCACLEYYTRRGVM